MRRWQPAMRQVRSWSFFRPTATKMSRASDHYLSERHSRTTEVFADRLDELFAVRSFPTVLILVASGKMVFRVNGFDPDKIEKELSAAIDRASLCWL